MSQVQTPEEIEAHYAEDGPVWTATRWLSWLTDARDLTEGWRLMDEDFRGELVNEWEAASGATMPVDADGISLGESEAQDFARWFAGWLIARLPQGDEFNLSNYGAGSRPRPTAPDYEVVRFVYTAGERISVSGPTVLPGFGLVLHNTCEGWRVVGFETFEGTYLAVEAEAS